LKKILILTECPRIKRIFGFDEIFARSFVAEKIKVSKKVKVSIIPEDLIGAKDIRLCDHLSFIAEEKVYNNNFNNASFQYLEKFGGNTFSRYLVGRSLSAEIIKLVRAIHFSKIVKNHFNLTERIYIYHHYISRQVFNIYKETIPELYDSDIILFRKYEMLLYDISRGVSGVLLSLLLPIMNILKVKNKTLDLKTSYKAGIHLYPGLGFSETQPMDYLIDGKRFTEDSTLFIIDYLFNEKWEKKIRESKHKVLNFNTELLPSISKHEYLSKYFITLFSNACSVAKLIFIYPWLAGQLDKHLQAVLLWSIFFDKSNIDYSFRAMIKGDLTSIAMQKKKNITTTFIYFSITSSDIDQRVDPEKSDCSDYTYMIFDQIMSSQISNKWFATLQNDIRHYISEPPIMSSQVTHKLVLRNSIRKTVGIDNNTILVTCFDHTTGYNGVLNYKAYYKFWDDMYKLQTQFPNHLFCIKTKKPWHNLLQIKNKKIVQILNKIDRSKSWLNAKDFNINHYTWMGLSDIVISAPVSSVIFESYYAGIKTISYDPLNQYYLDHYPAENFEGLSTHSFDQLKELYNIKINNITN
jgi:polysaccharide biosynthesis PFTS motif protein